jgi:hypothetical protein
LGIRYSTGSVRHDGDAPLVLVVAAKLHRARDLGDDGVVLGTPRLEQLGHPRQTAGNVAGLGALSRNARQDVARHHLMARLDREDRIDRQEVACLRAARQLGDLALLVLDHHGGTQIGAARGCTPIDDHAIGDTGRLVAPLGHGHAFDQVLEVDRAFDLRQHRAGIGIPLGQPVAALHLLPVLDAQMRAVGQPVHGPLGPVLVENDDRGVAAHDHGAAL